MRKLFGYLWGLLGFMVYIILITRLGDAIFPMHLALEIIYYAVAGIGWIFPAMWFIKWWTRPKNT